MLEDITIESSSTVEILVSGYSDAAVVAMDTLVHKTKIHHMVGPSARVRLDHNSSPYDFFNLIMSEEFRSVILQECKNTISAMAGDRSKGDRYNTQIIQTSLPSHRSKLIFIYDFFYLMTST